MTLGFGGWGSHRKSMALVREILRSPVKDLTGVSIEIAVAPSADGFSVERFPAGGASGSCIRSSATADRRDRGAARDSPTTR
jgi:acyl CoA:acetate/3-ketoacid CoA transferase alpha subunit